MSEINENIEIVEEVVEVKIKKGRGRPRIPEEDKKPIVKKEKIHKEPKPKPEKPKPIFKQRNTEPHARVKPGPKTGTVIKAHERYLDDGTYDKKPKDKEYFNKYYHEVLRVQHTCEKCNNVLTSRANLARHQKSLFCKTTFEFKHLPDFDTLFEPIDV